MNHSDFSSDNPLVELQNAKAKSPVILVCEHASDHIPARFGSLGLAAKDRQSHVVWDPGARAVAKHLSAKLNAVLVAAKTSRLVYDCNRPPNAPDAIPERSEVIAVPGNTGLSEAERATRVAQYYRPFQSALAAAIARQPDPVIVTIHSFTPVYHGTARRVEIGVLHDADSRLADALLADEELTIQHIIRRNEPYGPQDGVTHTLKEHALPHGHLNVMLEIRNDLLGDAKAQSSMADKLARWLSTALATLGVAQCKA